MKKCRIQLDKRSILWYFIYIDALQNTLLHAVIYGGIVMTFGEKLKNLRISCNKTQGEVAKETGIAMRSIQLYEYGETLPRFERIYQALSDYFNVPVEFWKNESDDDFKKCAEYAYGVSGKMQAEKMANEIAGLFAGGKVSEEDADKVMRIMEKAYWRIKERKADQNGDNDNDDNND